MDLFKRYSVHSNLHYGVLSWDLLRSYVRTLGTLLNARVGQLLAYDGLRSVILLARRSLWSREMRGRGFYLPTLGICIPSCAGLPDQWQGRWPPLFRQASFSIADRDEMLSPAGTPYIVLCKPRQSPVMEARLRVRRTKKERRSISPPRFPPAPSRRWNAWRPSLIKPYNDQAGPRCYRMACILLFLLLDFFDFDAT